MGAFLIGSKFISILRAWLGLAWPGLEEEQEFSTAKNPDETMLDKRQWRSDTRCYASGREWAKSEIDLR